MKNGKVFNYFKIKGTYLWENREHGSLRVIQHTMAQQRVGSRISYSTKKLLLGLIFLTASVWEIWKSYLLY